MTVRTALLMPPTAAAVAPGVQVQLAPSGYTARVLSWSMHNANVAAVNLTMAYESAGAVVRNFWAGQIPGGGALVLNGVWVFDDDWPFVRLIIGLAAVVHISAHGSRLVGQAPP